MRIQIVLVSLLVLPSCAASRAGMLLDDTATPSARVSPATLVAPVARTRTGALPPPAVRTLHAARVTQQVPEPRVPEPRVSEPRLSEPRLSEPRLSETMPVRAPAVGAHAPKPIEPLSVELLRRKTHSGFSVRAPAARPVAPSLRAPAMGSVPTVSGSRSDCGSTKATSPRRLDPRTFLRTPVLPRRDSGCSGGT